MPFIDEKIFWGCFFIFLGAIVLLKVFFKINIPLLKIALGVFLVYSGLVLIFDAKLPIFNKKCFSVNVDFNHEKQGSSY